jgi:SAM-dependent methyltransferase
VTVSAVLVDPKRLRRLVAFVRPEPGDRLLDIGRGVIASAFGRRVRTVVSLAWDLRRRRPANVVVEPADPLQLPFPDDTFDIAACGPTFHHLASPRAALAEMERVLRPGGRVVLDDIIASGQKVRARYQDRLERLRDRSHPGYLRLSQIIAFIGETGLHVRRLQVQDLPREFNEWLIGGRSTLARIEHIRRLMVGAVESDLSGLHIRPVDDTILFTQQIAWIIAEKPG